MSLSFRSRLFLSAIASVALVLGIVMATAWVRVLDLEGKRFNARLCSEAARVAREDFSPRERQDLEADIARKLHLGASSFVRVRQTNPQGEPVFQSDQWGQTVPQEPGPWEAFAEAALAPAPAGTAARCEVSHFRLGTQDWQIARASEGSASGLVAASLDAAQVETQGVLLDVLRTVLPVALVLSGIAAWVLSASLARPVRRLRASMRSVTPTDLSARLASDGEDQEFRDLIASYNTMLERLERSFRQASRFSADAAHELKTPLTVLRGNIERLRRTTQDAGVHAQLSGLLDEVSRLAAITRKLLLLSQADAGKLELHSEAVDLSTLLRELMDDAQMAADGQGVHSDVAPGLQVRGDLLLLRQLFNNLVSNALRYTPEGGRIHLAARADGASVEVQLSNTSAPIPQATRARFFERFFRGDDGQPRKIEGSGLGLCIAQEIAIAHHGSLALMPSPDTEVVLLARLPAT